MRAQGFICAYAGCGESPNPTPAHTHSQGRAWRFSGSSGDARRAVTSTGPWPQPWHLEGERADPGGRHTERGAATGPERAALTFLDILSLSLPPGTTTQRPPEPRTASRALLRLRAPPPQAAPRPQRRTPGHVVPAAAGKPFLPPSLPASLSPPVRPGAGQAGAVVRRGRAWRSPAAGRRCVSGRRRAGKALPEAGGRGVEQRRGAARAVPAGRQERSGGARVRRAKGEGTGRLRHVLLQAGRCARVSSQCHPAGRACRGAARGGCAAG